MTVAQLQALLAAAPPEAEVVVLSDRQGRALVLAHRLQAAALGAVCPCCAAAEVQGCPDLAGATAVVLCPAVLWP